MRLRILDYLCNIQEHKGVALSANLKCTCGSSEFHFVHTGTQTKGILRPFIVKKHRQLVLMAECPRCSRNIIVYNSTTDGAHPCAKDITCDFVPFISGRTPNHVSVVIKYNYCPENLKTEGEYSNCFENCYIYLIDEKGKEKALIEE